MAPRALGALFALVAALAFAIALAGGLVPKTIPGWWDGHPIVNGKVYELKAIHVGLLEADGCNLGETVKCETLETGHTLDVVGFAEIGALGLGIVTALVTGFSVWKLGRRRKFFGKLLLFEVLLIGGGAGAIFFHGPDLHVSFQLGMPVGLGLMSLAAGCGLALIGSLVAMRVEPEPLRLRTSEPRMPQQHPHQQQPAFDVRELLRADQQGQPPQPMRVSSPHMMPPSPGGPLAGPSGPLGAPAVTNPQPLFESAPHLRPLYDMQNQGAAPNPAMDVRPQMQHRPPTPVSRAEMSQQYGTQPPPLEYPTPATHGLPPDFPSPGDSASLHAPIREPYSPPRSIEQTADLERENPSVVDPLGSMPFQPAPPFTESPTTPRHGNAQQAASHAAAGERTDLGRGPLSARAAAAVAAAPPPRRAPRPSAPPPPPRTPGSKHPTIAAAVPPPPPVVVDTEEPKTNVEIDHAAKAASRESMSDLAMTVPVDRFNADESRISAPIMRPEQSTDESVVVGDSTSQTAHAPENFDDVLTREPQKFSEAELAVAETQMAPPIGAPQRPGSEAPTSHAPARATSAVQASASSWGAHARADSEQPTAHARVDAEAPSPFESKTFAGGEESTFESKTTAGEPEPARERVSTPRAGTKPLPSEPVAPPAPPASAAVPPGHAAPAAAASAPPSSVAAKPPSLPRVRPTSPPPTPPSRPTPNPAPAGEDPYTVMNRPARASRQSDQHQALPDASLEGPTVAGGPDKSKSSGPQRSLEAPTITGRANRPSAPPPTLGRATGPRPALGRASDSHPALENPTVPGGPTTADSVPVPSFAITPSAAHVAPIDVSVPKAPLPAPPPSQRAGRPSVPPPAKFAGFGAKPITSVPSIVPSNGIGKPPSNLEPAQTANKHATTSTPSPFATIPSPFGPKPTEQATAPTTAPTTASTPLGDRPTELASTDGLHEAPTQAPRRTRATSDIIEPPTHAVHSPPERPSELPTRAVGAGGRTNEVAAPAAPASPASPQQRPKWDRAASEASKINSAPETSPSTSANEAATRAVGMPGPTLPTGPRRPTQQRATTPPEETKVPMSTAPTTLPPPKKAQQTMSGPTPACPQCEAPMAWVEEHLRFYCASCRMYF